MMMDDPQDPVNDEVADTSTPEAENQQPAQVPAEETPPLESAPTESMEADDVDERGVPWRNRAMEAERKLTELPAMIPQIVQETLSKQPAQQQGKQEYGKEHIPQLRQYARDNPQHAEWVEDTIADIRTKEMANAAKSQITEFQKQQADMGVRAQSEARVIADPAFKSCFVDVAGQKQWNMQDPLAQTVIAVLNTQDPVTGKLLRDRPDGLAIAADIAYGRFARAQGTRQVQRLRSDLRKTQKATMPATGAGNVPPAQKSPIRKSIDSYKTTQSKSDLTSAIKGILLTQGIIRED